MSSDQVVAAIEWTLGDRLRKARRTSGLTADALAIELGVSKRAVSAYELDDRTPKLRTLIRWAEITGVPFDWLCGVDTSTKWYSPPSRAA